jgi:hypothetical protein
MSTKSTLTVVLASAFSLAWSNYALAEVQSKYDQFKDKTSITVTGEWVKNKPVLHVRYQTNGQKPDPKQSAQVGFFVNKACGNPRFLADGKRVEVEAGSESPTDLHLTLNEYNEDTRNIEGFFGFSFYNLPQIKQIATAKSVHYKLCSQVFLLSPQEQAELRKFLSYFKK